VAGRASIVGAAATHVGKVREHNEDAHHIDTELGMFLVCDGMGGHAAGEVASAIAIGAIRQEWGRASLSEVAEAWLERGTAAAKKQLLDALRAGVVAAHEAILAEAGRDTSKTGMGTTLVGAIIVGGELVFAHAGDSRAYLVRDGISMQLTEDHTLLARLVAAGIDVDVSGEGSRFRSMLTNALGIGDEVKVSTFVVPLADGDRFLLCSDGISEYVRENEIGDVLTKQPSPARGAQRLIDLALERGGGDNATAVVVRVLEAGETPLPAEQRKRDDAAIAACALWGKRVTPQQRLRALRIAIPRDHASGEKLPAHALGDRVAWIVVEGHLVQDGAELGPGALVYPEGLLTTREPVPMPDRDAHAIARTDVRALAIRADDFRELCDDDSELGEALLESLAALIKRRAPARRDVDPSGATDPQLRAVPRAHDEYEAYHATDPSLPTVETLRDRAATVPDLPEPPRRITDPDIQVPEPLPAPPPGPGAKPRGPESARIGPALPRTPVQAPSRPSPPPPSLERARRPSAPTRPSPIPSQLAASTRPVTLPPAPGPIARPSPLPAQLHVRPAQGAPITTSRAHAETRPQEPVSGIAKTPPSQRPAYRADGRDDGTPKGFAPALAPPPRHDRKRPPTEPEIETFLEMEADLPPAGGADHELGLGLALATRTLASDDDAELTLTIPDEPVRQRAITAEDASAVSGTISIPEDDPQPEK
jgi:serine/threonine protein phosphatase PrpC